MLKLIVAVVTFFLLKPAGSTLCGDKLCAGRRVGSWCKPDTGTCHWFPELQCKCPSISSETTGRSLISTTVVPAAGLSGNALCASLRSGSWCKKDTGTCQWMPTVKCTGSPVNLSIASPRPEATPPVSTRSYRTEAETAKFLWLDFPTTSGKHDWEAYYETVLSFVANNCSSIRVNKLILRVNEPEFQSKHGKLWQVSTESVFYTHLLSRVPEGVEIHIMPYLPMEAASVAKWTSYGGSMIPLENAFIYVRDWNRLLAETRQRTRISGVVIDREEKGARVDKDIHHVTRFKTLYASDGVEQLRFGYAIPYDMGGFSSKPYVDDYYVEMYDFYDHGIYPPLDVRADAPGLLNNPAALLDKLDQDVWYPHLIKYRDSRIQFMWSAQNGESRACIYPLASGYCGPIKYQNNIEKSRTVDFGAWTSAQFKEFLSQVQVRHPVFNNRSHGLFQFSLIPTSWFNRC